MCSSHLQYLLFFEQKLYDDDHDDSTVRHNTAFFRTKKNVPLPIFCSFCLRLKFNFLFILVLPLNNNNKTMGVKLTFI